MTRNIKPEKNMNLTIRLIINFVKHYKNTKLHATYENKVKSNENTQKLKMKKNIRLNKNINEFQKYTL